jgi:hypothetical protein
MSDEREDAMREVDEIAAQLAKACADLGYVAFFLRETDVEREVRVIGPQVSRDSGKRLFDAASKAWAERPDIKLN